MSTLFFDSNLIIVNILVHFMRKTAAYIVSLIFLFMSGIAILHPSYEALSSWLSPLTGGYIYTVFMCFTLLIADPLKYTSVGLTWVTAGLLIGVISQKKLGASITAFFTWLSMIPTLGISFFGIYQNVEAKGLLTLDSVDKIINFIPNIPDTLRLTSFLEVPIITELAITAMEMMPTLGENGDPMSLVLGIAMPYVTAIVLKPVLIIVSAIGGAIIGKMIFSRIDLDLLPNRKVAAAIVSVIVLSQAAQIPLAIGQEIDLDMLMEMGLDIEALEALGIDIDTLMETGFDPDALAEMGVDIDMLIEMGLDIDALMEMGLDSGMGIEFESSIDLENGIYVEALVGYVEDQGRAITGELLLGTGIETVDSNEPYMQDLAVSAIVTQKIFDPTFLYTLPIEGIENYVQFTNLIPETVALTVYVGDDVEAATLKSDQLIAEYETMYGIEFGRIVSQPVAFTEDGEGGESMIPPYVISVYYSLNTLEETIPNLLTGFESKQGFANSFQERIDGDPLDVELFVTGQITPEHVQAFIPIPDDLGFLQELVDTLVAETYHFAAGVQMINEAVSPSSGSTFDLRDALGIGTPRYSRASDISMIVVARPNNTEPEADFKISTSLAQDSMELMFIGMYLDSILDVEMHGGSAPSSSNMQISILDYTAPEVEIVKTSQATSDGSTVTITVTNEGSSTLSDLMLKDAFPTKYGILDSGDTEATWSRLSPGQSVSISYVASYENPGVYTDIPAMLSYVENDATRSAASNTLPTSTKNPSPIRLLSDSYQATFDLIDMVTGNGDLFQMIPLVLIALIAAVDIFKMYRNRSTVEPQAQGEPLLPEPPSDEDTPVDLP
jgi:hypothetical protein